MPKAFLQLKQYHRNMVRLFPFPLWVLAASGQSLVTDASSFEGLIQLLKHGHPFPLSHLMDDDVRHMRRAQNLLDIPTSLKQQPEVRQITKDISCDTAWVQPCQPQQSDLLYCTSVNAYTQPRAAVRVQHS